MTRPTVHRQDHPLAQAHSPTAGTERHGRVRDLRLRRLPAAPRAGARAVAGRAATAPAGGRTPAAVPGLGRDLGTPAGGGTGPAAGHRRPLGGAQGGGHVMRRVEGCEAWCALVVRVDALRDARVATPPCTITEATAIPCQGTARQRDGGWRWTRRWRRWHTCRHAGSGGSNRRRKIMPTHAHRAHWHAQETVAKTILAAAHAKRLAAQGRLPHVRWATRRRLAAAARWGEALLAMRAVRGGRSLSTTRGAHEPRLCTARVPRVEPAKEHGRERSMTIACQNTVAHASL